MKVLVTGGTNGMGLGAVKALAGADKLIHEIIILCRSPELGESTLHEIKNQTKNNKLSYILCDLSKLNDVKKAVKEINSKHKHLDCIFINAGLGYAKKRIPTEDGLDPHFQVNYLSQFMLTLNLIELLKNSEKGGRVIFNVTRGGEIFWDDIQMEKKWNFEKAVQQAMVCKRMLSYRLHSLLCRKTNLSFIGFQIHKTVWSNQINIIPFFMKTMARIMKLFNSFITIEECGNVMLPLFTEKQDASIKKSGQIITWKNGSFVSLKEDEKVFNNVLQDKLWKLSLDLCSDKQTIEIAENLSKET